MAPCGGGVAQDTLERQHLSAHLPSVKMEDVSWDREVWEFSAETTAPQTGHG